jgi:hypothetical protein
MTATFRPGARAGSAPGSTGRPPPRPPSGRCPPPSPSAAPKLAEKIGLTYFEYQLEILERGRYLQPADTERIAEIKLKASHPLLTRDGRQPLISGSAGGANTRRIVTCPRGIDVHTCPHARAGCSRRAPRRHPRRGARNPHHDQDPRQGRPQQHRRDHRPAVAVPPRRGHRMHRPRHARLLLHHRPGPDGWVAASALEHPRPPALPCPPNCRPHT